MLGNDLANPGVNAFDSSSGDTRDPSKVWFDVADIKKLPAFPSDRTNHWDDDVRGNHYSDFDEPSEGFADKDGNGIGELGHAIPGGNAVDRYPLATGADVGRVGEAEATSAVAGTSCGLPVLCPAAATDGTACLLS